MTRLRLLDLFCGAGGAAVGYHRAGFDVTGVDIAPQPHYPYEFRQGDALTFDLDGYDVVHASPPCQAYSLARNNGCHPDAPDLVPAVLERFATATVPWIVENVPAAPLPAAFELCGASFGLGVSGMDLNRHRRFQSNLLLLAPPCQHRRGHTIGVYGGGTNAWHRRQIGRNIQAWETRAAMGIDWMTRHELTQAVPPAYTEWIGTQLLQHLLGASHGPVTSGAP